MAGTAATREPAGFTFTERMQGFISPGVSGYRQAAARGRAAGDALSFTVTITVPDLDAFLRDPAHEALLTGTVSAPRFGGARPIIPGTFNLLVRDPDGHRKMRYRFAFDGADGRRYRLDGYKDVRAGGVLSVWPQTTTLFVTVRQEDVPHQPVVATGVLRIRPFDLVPQVWSMRGVGVRGVIGHAHAVLRFGRFFAGELWDEYAPRGVAARLGCRRAPAPAHGASGEPR